MQKQLKENGNAPAIFNVDNLTAFEAIVFRRSDNNVIKSEVSNQKKSIRSGVPSQGTSQGTSRGTSRAGCTKSNSIDNQDSNIKDDEKCTKSSVPSRDDREDKCTKSSVPSQDASKGGCPKTDALSRGINADFERQYQDGLSIVKRNVLDFCSKPRSLKEIAEFLGIKAFKRVKTRYIDSLLAEGRLAMTVPDKPTSRFQKYVAI